MSWHGFFVLSKWNGSGNTQQKPLKLCIKREYIITNDGIFGERQAFVYFLFKRALREPLRTYIIYAVDNVFGHTRIIKNQLILLRSPRYIDINGKMQNIKKRVCESWSAVTCMLGIRKYIFIILYVYLYIVYPVENNNCIDRLQKRFIITQLVKCSDKKKSQQILFKIHSCSQSTHYFFTPVCFSRTVYYTVMSRTPPSLYIYIIVGN